MKCQINREMRFDLSFDYILISPTYLVQLHSILYMRSQQSAQKHTSSKQENLNITSSLLACIFDELFVCNQESFFDKYYLGFCVSLVSPKLYNQLLLSTNFILTGKRLQKVIYEKIAKQMLALIIIFARMPLPQL